LGGNSRIGARASGDELASLGFRVGNPSAIGWHQPANFDYCWAGGDIGRIRTFAKELVELAPDILVAYATPSVVALQQLHEGSLEDA
jgi:hypothetical protein